MRHALTRLEFQVPKEPSLRTFLEPLTGKEDLVTMEGPTWKRWRSIFNPGFSSTHISSLVPGMIEKVLIFKNALAQQAGTGDLFYMEELTLSLTIDIIGGAVM